MNIQRFICFVADRVSASHAASLIAWRFIVIFLVVSHFLLDKTVDPKVTGVKQTKLPPTTKVSMATAAVEPKKRDGPPHKAGLSHERASTRPPTSLKFLQKWSINIVAIINLYSIIIIFKLLKLLSEYYKFSKCVHFAFRCMSFVMTFHS